jgi:hypothetical protein
MTNELISSKYTFVCDPDECDSLIELTSSDGFGFPSGVTELTCPCGRKTTLLSVEHATIPPITTTKEDKMETTTIGSDALHSPAVAYDANQLVTYKILHGFSDPEYTTSKVASLEWDLHNGRQAQKHNGVYQSKIDSVKSIIINSFPDSDDQDTLTEIAEALGIELTKEITWEATIHVSGTMQVSLTDDYDFESELNDNLFVDSQHGDIEIGDYEVANVQEAY